MGDVEEILIRWEDWEGVLIEMFFEEITYDEAIVLYVEVQNGDAYGAD